MDRWKPSTQLVLFITSIALAPGCPSDDAPADTGTDGVDAASGSDPTTSTPTTSTPTTTTMDSDSNSAGSSSEGSTSAGSSSGSGGSGSGSDSSGSGGSSSSSGSSGSGSSTGGGQTVLNCGNQVYACGDLEDNDGDGFIDLLDPECTGPCDDDESSFATGIPGDNMDCNQDCFFDGNSGQGDDGCNWNLRCDPENPGANIGCEYTGGNNCPDKVGFSKECLEFCSPLSPPGCDCFGCCTVETDEGSVDIFLNGGEDCSLDNLEACEPCTSQIEECGNTCEPMECELCFGETELPEGCDENTCDNGASCNNDGDCPQFEYCYLGCCYPLPG